MEVPPPGGGACSPSARSYRKTWIVDAFLDATVFSPSIIPLSCVFCQQPSSLPQCCSFRWSLASLGVIHHSGRAINIRLRCGPLMNGQLRRLGVCTRHRGRVSSDHSRSRSDFLGRRKLPEAHVRYSDAVVCRRQRSANPVSCVSYLYRMFRAFLIAGLRMGTTEQEVG